MARYIVSALNSVQTPAGAVLERITGPGWMETPASLLSHLVNGRHEFVLDGSSCRLGSRRDARGNWVLVVVDGDGQEVPAQGLPHWRAEGPQRKPVQARRWWQRLLDPDAA